jgi:hypothetical protein
MHYCISNEISKLLDVNKNRFIVGGISPDLPQLAEVPKEESHFMKTHTNGLKYDYCAFFTKYKDKFDDSFFRGYFCHLVSDEIWFRKIISKYVNPVSCDEETRRKYYLDFCKLNGILIKHFKQDDTIVSVNGIEVDEININTLYKMVEQIHEDFKYNPIMLDEPLDIFKVDDIIEYINEAVETAYYKLTKILSQSR